MKRTEALRALAPFLEDSLVVSANGMTSRELHALGDRPEWFYMIGSMGLASSIGLGLALARPERRVVVVDGDGNLLMNLGSLANVAERAPANFFHIVLDNRAHDSTGGQRTISGAVPLERVALACGYRRAVRARDESELARRGIPEFAGGAGPAMLLVEIEPGTPAGLPRVEVEPSQLARRFRERATASS